MHFFVFFFVYRDLFRRSCKRQSCTSPSGAFGLMLRKEASNPFSSHLIPLCQTTSNSGKSTCRAGALFILLNTLCVQRGRIQQWHGRRACTDTYSAWDIWDNRSRQELTVQFCLKVQMRWNVVQFLRFRLVIVCLQKRTISFSVWNQDICLENFFWFILQKQAWNLVLFNLFVC